MSTADLTQVTNRSYSRQDFTKVAILVSIISLFFISTVYAGTDNGAFDEVWITLKDWTQGTLGRIVAGSMILVGVVGGIARQSLMAFATGIGGGVGLYNAPEIIETIMTATLEHAHTLNAVSVQIGNGLGM